MDFSHQRPHTFTERYRPAKSWIPGPAENTVEIHNRRTRRLRERIAEKISEDISLSSPVPEKTPLVELGNKELPAYEYKQEIKEAVRDHQVTIVMGETGCGKSTQIPQFILEDGYDITMTQPRILAANGVAERIETEINECMGASDTAELVGVHTSERKSTTPRTKISVVTDGLRLAQDISDRGEIKNEVLIIDEVHEWNNNIEVLVAWSKKLIAEKPNLRVVVMSATMNAHKLANYFSDATGDLPPVIEMEGRTFPVERSEQSGSTAVKEVLKYTEKDKTLLVFMPGKREIQDTISELEQKLPPEIAKDAVLLPLHSKLSKQEQDRIYMQTPGRLKVIVATNVAQTSVTIPDVDIVVDTGLERRIEFDEEEVGGLELHPISQNDCDQRAGRAGRTKPGLYVLTRLNQDSEFTPYIERHKEATPEILRSDISRTVLRVADYGMEFEDLDLYHPVSKKAIIDAKEMLYRLGALDDDEKITARGRYMNKFPLRPIFGRMMSEAEHKSENVRKHMAAITASWEEGGLQQFGYGISKRWEQLIEGEDTSDPIAQLRLFIATQHLQPEIDNQDRRFFISDYDLDDRSVYRAHHQYHKIARNAGVYGVYTPIEAPTDQELEEVRRCIYSGMGEFIFSHADSRDEKPLYTRIDSTSRTQRSISNRSVVKQPSDLIVGLPYRYEKYEKGRPIPQQVIEHVTKVMSRTALMEALPEYCTPRVKKIVWRDGYPRVKREYYLHDIPLGVTEEGEVSYSAEVRDALIHQIFKKPGEATRRLLSLKYELEDLSNRNQHELMNVLTQNQCLQIMKQAADARRTLSPWEFEASLEKMVPFRDQFIQPEARDRIIESSPDSIELLGGQQLPLKYRKGKPIGRYIPSPLPNTVQLSDGRNVLFEKKTPGDKRKTRLYTVEKLRELGL